MGCGNFFLTWWYRRTKVCSHQQQQKNVTNECICSSMHACMQVEASDGRQTNGERGRASEVSKEGRERGGGGGGGSRRRNDNKQHIYIYKATRHFTPIIINKHHFFPKTFTNLTSHHPKKPNLPKKCNSSPSSPPLPSQPLPLQSSRPGVERKSAPVEHHIVANWTFWALLLFLARMVSTYST